MTCQAVVSLRNNFGCIWNVGLCLHLICFGFNALNSFMGGVFLMLLGRVYRIFQRYADTHVAFEMPGGMLRDASNQLRVEVRSVAVRRNRLWVHAVGQAHTLDVQINNIATRAVAMDAGGGVSDFSVDIPLEVGSVVLHAQTSGNEATLLLPGVSGARLAWARQHQALRFCVQLVGLGPQIYRWKWNGDLRAREVVKERLGLVPRSEATVLASTLFKAPDPSILPAPVATLVMPVFNAFDLLPDVLDRVVRHSGDGWRLVLVEDCSTDVRVRPFLEEWCAGAEIASQVSLLKLPENLGFVGAANSGLIHAQTWPDDPVVLLNSDAFVPRGWLARLLAPLADQTVASVTPMSNDAEIFSVPAICQRSVLRCGAVDVLDKVAARFDPATAIVDVPTGVGFCMALAPSFLQRVPLFDTAFGRGYGEENDWCQKTRALGGRHVGVGNLFVEHRGGISFGTATKQRLLEQNLAKLVRRYPFYENEVQDFIQHDPMATARLALGLAWAGQHQKDAVPVYLAHAMGGGAEFDLERRIAHDIQAGGAAVVVRVGLRKRWQIELHSGHGLTLGLCDDTDTLLAVVGMLPHRRIIYSCGVGDKDPIGLPHVMMQLADEGKHAIEVLMHDYFPISPSYTLLDATGLYHGVPLPGDAHAADPAHQPRQGTLADWQAAWGMLLGMASRITVFSEASRKIVSAVYPQSVAALEVVPHTLRHVPLPVTAGQQGPVIGVLGNIGVQKGAVVVQALARDLARTKAGKVVVIGYMDPAYHLAKPSHVHGAYELCDLPRLVARYRISCWLIPSVWPETFSFTTHEALATGLPVFAFDLGAQGDAVAEAVAKGAPGAVLPLPSAQGDDLVTILDQILSPRVRGESVAR
jgi:GT2 family glycosyltransferase/glycosyltransferase involved in cell wall biosynthesis